MKHTFEVTVSQGDADIALRRFIVRGAGWSTVLVFALGVAYIVYEALTSGIGYVGVVMITLLGMLMVCYVAAIIIRRKQMTELLSKLGAAPVTYVLTDSEIATESPIASSSLNWGMIKKVWIDLDLVLVFYARNAYATIPMHQMPSEALAFLVEQVRQVGGSVIDNTNRQNN